MRVPMLLTAIFIAGALLWVAISNLSSGDERPERNQSRNESVAAEPPEPKVKKVIGEYRVAAERAYFHNEADAATRRAAYMIPSEEVIRALEEQNGFIYTEFTNSKGQTSKGWLRKEDLMTVEAYNQWLAEQQKPLTKIEINQQLQEARAFVEQRQLSAALTIYRKLAEQEVPEAMYELGNRSLKGEYNDLDCDAAYAMVQKASERGHTPAKRTLGFLYLFGQNKDVLRMSNYNRCNYDRNVVKGTRLLLEAASEGDSTANDILTDFNDQNTENQNNQE